MTTVGGGNMFIGNSMSSGAKNPKDCQLTLGGVHNSSGYNDDGQVKLYITGSNNDSGVNYPIYCEDENANVLFTARNNGSTFGFGLGTNAPDSLLHLKGSGARITLQDTGSDDLTSKITSSSGVLYLQSRNGSSHGSMIFRTENSSTAVKRAEITSAGDFMVGRDPAHAGSGSELGLSLIHI